MATPRDSGADRTPASTPRRPTIHTIADAAGVSIATVSYVLNGRDLRDDKIKIGAKTRLRVLEVAEEFGYHANFAARVMRRGRTEQVCLALSYPDSPWTQSMVTSVAEASRSIGMTSLFLLDRNWQDYLARGGADAAVIHGTNLTPSDVTLLRTLGEQGVVVVALEYPGEPVGFDTVRKRMHGVLTKAVKMLVARHERVACLHHGAGASAEHVRRFEAYTAVLEQAGRPLDTDLVRVTQSDRYRAYHAAIDLLDRDDRPTAIYATNDLSAVSALWAAYRLGLDVPADLEIVGVGNSKEGVQTDPPLTTVGPAAVFDDVARLLVARLTGNEEPSERVHYNDWSLYERGTTRSGDAAAKTSPRKGSPA